LQQVTHASDAVLLVRQFMSPGERCLVYDKEGKQLDVTLVPFNRSIAGSVVSIQDACILRDLDRSAGGSVELQPFERGRRCVLAIPLGVAANVQAIIELFDKRGPAGDAVFTPEDQRLLQAAAAFGTDLLRQALTQRQTNQVLLDAVIAALGAGDHVAQSLAGTATNQRPEQPPPAEVMDQLREGLRTSGSSAAEAGAQLRLAEAIRVLAVRHGSAAVEHCVRLVESLRELLDKVAGV
jgi:hypothetical protein